jgi:hypothetical protein
MVMEIRPSGTARMTSEKNVHKVKVELSSSGHDGEGTDKSNRVVCEMADLHTCVRNAIGADDKTAVYISEIDVLPHECYFDPYLGEKVLSLAPESAGQCSASLFGPKDTFSEAHTPNVVCILSSSPSLKYGTLPKIELPLPTDYHLLEGLRVWTQYRPFKEDFYEKHPERPDEATVHKVIGSTPNPLFAFLMKNKVKITTNKSALSCTPRQFVETPEKDPVTIAVPIEVAVHAVDYVRTTERSLPQNQNLVFDVASIADKKGYLASPKDTTVIKISMTVTCVSKKESELSK